MCIRIRGIYFNKSRFSQLRISIIVIFIFCIPYNLTITDDLRIGYGIAFTISCRYAHFSENKGCRTGKMSTITFLIFFQEIIYKVSTFWCCSRPDGIRNIFLIIICNFLHCNHGWIILIKSSNSDKFLDTVFVIYRNI